MVWNTEANVSTPHATPRRRIYAIRKRYPMCCKRFSVFVLTIIFWIGYPKIQKFSIFKRHITYSNNNIKLQYIFTKKVKCAFRLKLKLTVFLSQCMKMLLPQSLTNLSWFTIVSNLTSSCIYGNFISFLEHLESKSLTDENHFVA